MKTFFSRFFIENWQRKLISLILSLILWLIVNHSMTTSKVIPSIPIRVINLPLKKTIEGMQINGLLNRRISLTVTGNKNVVEDLVGRDLEVVIDAQGKPNQWIATITKKNLISLNSDIDITKAISRVIPQDIILKQNKLVTEKVPIVITQPTGEAPQGYQLLDVWPYQLHITVTGPEDTVKRLKTHGLKLTFNLNEISLNDLEALQTTKKSTKDSDEISFFIPSAWKKIAIPILSESPLEIDDPQASLLRIGFHRQELLPIDHPIPVEIFFPQKYSNALNPKTHSLLNNDWIIKKHGLHFIEKPLFAHGVSRQFIEIVKDMLQIKIIAMPKAETGSLPWNVQFINPNELENRYVAKMFTETQENQNDAHQYLHEDLLRNRFRTYMKHFRLFTTSNEKLSLNIELKSNSIIIIAR